MEKLTTRKQYDEVKAHVERLITEATAKGMLEPEMDNAYTQEIAQLSKQMAQYGGRVSQYSPIAPEVTAYC